MMAISMLPGLAIVVFLSVVGPVWMEVDISRCSFPSNKMKNIMLLFQGKEGTEIRYHATHVTYTYLPTLVSSLFVIKRRGNDVTIRNTVEVKDKNGKITCFFNSTKLLLDVKKNWVMEAQEVYGYRIYYQLLHHSAGKIAVLTRYYKNGVEYKPFGHITLATLNPADKLHPVEMARKFCGDKMNVALGFFTALTVNPKLKKTC